MVLAILLIKAVPEQEKLVFRALKEIVGIKSLYHIFGNHDFFLILEAESMTHLNRLLNEIYEINYVGAVKTMLVGPTDSLSMCACEIENPACLTA
jgi:DNA-binding Lrp family transcriptional regulator